MQELIFFFGRFHVLVLHLPIGMVILAVAADWLSRSPNRHTLAAALPILWGATAITAVVTVVLGYMHFAEGGFTGPSALAHRLYGTAFAVACIAVWLLNAKQERLYRKLRIVAGVGLLVLVTMTGHYGGNLTHGSEYLVEYAPQPLRTLVGMPDRRPPVTELAMADPWHDIVQPMLNSRCVSCHNEDKRNGELSIVDYDSLMRGGETGRVIAAGNAAVSELYRRVTLSADEEAFMPAEGKPPLTVSQVEILRWWIDAGAPVDTTVASIELPDEIAALMRVDLGLDGSSPTTAAAVAADSAVIDALFEAGFLARQVSQSDPRLVVSIHSVGADLNDEQLGILSLAAASIADLDLQSAGLDDSDLAAIDEFAALRVLRLSNNNLTDAGVAALAGMQNLEVLNLYGNASVGDDALDSLAALENLTAVYLWGTAVTPEGIERLRALRPQLEVHGGATAFTAGATRAED